MATEIVPNKSGPLAMAMAAALISEHGSIERAAEAVPDELVLPAVLRFTELKKIAEAAIKVLEGRILLSPPTGAYLDPATESYYVWIGSQGDWEYDDPPTLKHELLEGGCDALEVAECFELKAKTTPINAIRDRIAAKPFISDQEKRVLETIANHRKRKPSGPPHMTVWAKNGKK